MDKFNVRLVVIVLAITFLLQVVCLLYDWQDLSHNGAAGRSILVFINGVSLSIIGTLNND